MGADEHAVKERIILATVACIEKEGIKAVTVRSIAKEAAVNVAAINYYFGSKDRLLEETLARTLGELAEALQELDQAIAAVGGDIRAGLRVFLSEFFGNMVRWPRLTEAQLHDALTKQDYDGLALRETNAFLEGFLERVRPILPPGDEEQQRLSVSQMWLGLFLLGMLPGAFERFAGSPASDAEWRERYLDRLLDHLTAGS